jgi:hypothetical protein
MMRIFLTVLVAFVALLGIESCKKGDDTAITTRSTNVNFINTTTDTLNYYVNGTRLNNASALYSLGATGYLSTPFGEQNYQVKKDGNPGVLFSLTMNLDTNKSYSVFTTDNTPENIITVVDTLTSVDTLSMVRFVHTSPKLANLQIKMNDTVWFANQNFKSVSDYSHIPPGEKHIKVIDVATGNVLINETRTLQVNRAYTLFTKGGLTATGGTASTGTGLIINE